MGTDTKRSAPIFETAEAFTSAANGYFALQDRNRQLYGEAGLCLHLSANNAGNRTVSVQRLRRWYDGDECDYLQDAVRLAYLKIQNQIDTDFRYREKGMIPRGIFLQKQKRFGGYMEKAEVKTDATIRIVHDDSVEKSDFE